MPKARPFQTEAALCAAFIAWAQKHEGVRCFAEWAGWDILLVYPDGHQLGIQAKLRLTAEVIGQAAPRSSTWDWKHDVPGPDFRGILVPDENGWSGLAERLGLVVFSYREGFDYGRRKTIPGFIPGLLGYQRTDGGSFNEHWTDWNPSERLDLPPCPTTDSVAGSSAPVTLTRWKLAALDVLAELAVRGTITAKRMRELGVHPGRWTTYRWLEPGEVRGTWTRGERCPRFDEQHPTAYVAALEKARVADPQAFATTDPEAGA